MQGGGRASQSHLFRAVGSHDQDPTALDASAQVEQQIDGTGIRPLQVVQHQQQWPLAGQGLHHPGVLLEEGILPQTGVRRKGRLPLHQFLQWG